MMKFTQQYTAGSLVALVLMVVVTVVLCDDENTDSAEPLLHQEFMECQRKARTIGRTMEVCYFDLFTPEELNVTREMYENTECIKCKHFCRKQDLVLHCLRDGAEKLELLSNKSRLMVPFVREIAETTITMLCENDAEIMLAASTEDDTTCIKNTWKECRPVLKNADDLDKSATCEDLDMENDPFTKEFMCQKILEFLECAETESGKCSTGVQSSTAKFISKLRNIDICSKYF